MTLCAVATIAAGGGVDYQNGRLILVAPKVVIAQADADRVPHAMSSPMWPEHALVLRENAQRSNARIIWDPWARFAVGAVLPAGARPNMPPGCQIPMQAPGGAVPGMPAPPPMPAIPRLPQAQAPTAQAAAATTAAMQTATQTAIAPTTPAPLVMQQPFFRADNPILWVGGLVALGVVGYFVFGSGD